MKSRMTFALLILVALLAVFASGCSCVNQQGIYTPMLTLTPGPTLIPNATPQPLDEIRIEPAVIMDAQKINAVATTVAITATHLELYVDITSEHADSLKISVLNPTVNGTDVRCGFDALLAPGASDTFVLLISRTELQGITTVTDIGLFLEFRSQEPGGDFGKVLAQSPYLNLHTSAWLTYATTYFNEGDTVLEREGVTMIYQGCDFDAEQGVWQLHFYTHNNSVEHIKLNVRILTVNDTRTNGTFGSELLPGKTAYHDLTFTTADLEAKGINTPENVGFEIVTYNLATMNRIFQTEAVTIALE